MRFLIGLFVAAVVLWGGYWFIGAQLAERGLAGWFDARRADGWQAEYTEIATIGFPNRFDTTVSGLELADTRSGLAWSAPFFQIFALTYKPHHVIAIWPDRQHLATPAERIEIVTGDMRGSLVFVPGPELQLARSSVVMEAMGLESSQGWVAAMDHGQLAAQSVEGAAQSYDLYFEAKGVTPASEFLKRLDQIDFLTGHIEGLSIDARVAFSAPWDRYAIERARPQPRHIDLRLLKAQWGQLDLWMAGELEVDSDGVPEGDITVKAKNWREMVAIGVELGLVPEALQGSIEGALGTLATLAGDPKTIDIPLSFADGAIYLGPVWIGDAPRLLLR